MLARRTVPAAGAQSRRRDPGGKPSRRCSTSGSEPSERGDRAAFLDTVDPAATPEFKVRQGHLFDGLRSLPLASYELELRTDEVPDLSAGLAARYPAPRRCSSRRWKARYRLTDIDTIDAVDGYYYTFLLREGRWRIVSDRDVEDVGLPSARNLWDFGPVQPAAHRPTSRSSTTPPTGSGRRRWAPCASRATPGSDRVSSGTRAGRPAQIVVILPHTLDQLREILQATFDLSNFVAFASASVDRDDDWESTAPRVYVQDANLSRSRRDFQLQTFHHEFTHVAAFPLAGPFVPVLGPRRAWPTGWPAARRHPAAVDGHRRRPPR